MNVIFQGKDPITGKVENQWASYVSIVFVLLFVVSFATGPGAIPWFYVSEIFSSSARGNANSIVAMSYWLTNFLVATFFLPVNNVLGQYTFLVFTAFIAFFIAFTFKFVPETKGNDAEFHF
jgi:SP family facilitated glucose transporter-like MFS transporter 1